MVKKRGLGKSLDALLAYTKAEGEQGELVDINAKEKLVNLSVGSIQRGKYQPRREIDPASLEELAHSIRTQGIIQPLIVRSIGQNHYEIVAGERRWHAAKLAGLKEVPAIVRRIPDDAAIAIALIENIQRENLNPIEEAIALQRLSDEFGLTHQQVADAVGKSRTAVTNLLRLLMLPEEVKDMLEQGGLEAGHARTLITLPAATQIEAAQLIVSRKLSVRETENLVRRLQTSKHAKHLEPLDPDIRHLQEELSEYLNLKVAIQCNTKGKGKLVIHYRNLAELDALVSHLQKS